MPTQDHSNLDEGSQGLAVHLSPASSFGHFELCDSSDQYTGELVEARAVGYDDGDNEVCEVTTPLPDASKSCDGATRFEVNVGLRGDDGSFDYQCTGGGDWNGNQGACDVSFHAAFLPIIGATPPPCADVDFTATADGID